MGQSLKYKLKIQGKMRLFALFFATLTPSSGGSNPSSPATKTRFLSGFFGIFRKVEGAFFYARNAVFLSKTGYETGLSIFQ